MIDKMESSINTINIDRLILNFQNLRMKTFDIPKFRGYLASEYKNYTLIHNHLENGRLRYAYPLIQFKVIDSQPTIVGIGEGIEILKNVFLDIGELDINGRRYVINEKSVQLNQVEFGQTENPVTYQFLLPWMGLNQENYRKYKKLKWNERRFFLENILRGNMKSLSKAFGYFIPDFDNYYVQTDLKSTIRNFKNSRMICFNGKFTTNFLIPDYLGIGKQTARGFGTVVKVEV